jgi:CBS domain-containing protein
MKKCSEIMTKDPVCCLPNNLVSKAAELMKSKNIGSVLIIDNKPTPKLIGIVTDRDLALRIIAMGRDAKSTRLEEVMTHDVVTCRDEEDLQRVLNLMSDYQVRRIPIMDDNDKLVGIISQADVATRVDHPEKTAELVREISQSASQ